MPANILHFFSLRRLALALGGLAALLALVAGAGIGWLLLFRPLLRPLTDRKYVSSPQRLERGRYVVENLAACLRCHSPNAMRKAHRAPRDRAGYSRLRLVFGSIE
jgi:hypothetical protein